MKNLLLLITLFALLCGCGSALPPGPIVFMGDSITDQWRDGLSVLAPGSVNVGIGGQGSYNMLPRFDNDVLALKPSLVVILAGTNDIYHDPVASTRFVFDMVQKSLAAGVPVIVGTIPPGGSWALSTQVHSTEEGQAAISRWNAEIRLGGETYGYTVADYYNALVLSDGSQNTALFYSDLTHPNDAGRIAMEAVLRPLLSGYVN